jgi:hypothetical protein
MTVYFVYKVTMSKDIYIRPILYGYSDNKKIIKQFRSQRDPKQFYIVKKTLSKKEFMLFEKDNRDTYINMRKYITFIMANGNRIKDYVEIASTQYEEEETYAKSDFAICEAAKFTTYPISIFNKNIVKALRTVRYDYISDFNNINYLYDMSYPYPTTNDININIDMFWVFMNLFGYTMNLNK